MACFCKLHPAVPERSPGVKNVLADAGRRHVCGGDAKQRHRSWKWNVSFLVFESYVGQIAAMAEWMMCKQFIGDE